MKNAFLLYIPLLTGVALCAESGVSAADVSWVAAVQPPTGGELPGKVIQSWLANSFSRDKGHHSVPVNIAGIAVTPDGTVFSAGVAEGYGGVASYKDGQFVTKYDYDSGFGSSASAVAVDDSYVYIGTGVGLFRTRRGDESYNRTPTTGGKISGLALFDGELYLSDSAAGIWQCSGNKTIFYLPCEGLDGRGNPIYRRASEVTYNYPPEFTGDRLRRLFYIPGEDTMLAGGSPGTQENACNMLICFEHWSDQARRAKRWRINLPLNDKSYTPNTGYGGGAPLAMQACGKYLFVAYGYGLVRVHRLDTGGYLGTIRPDINGFKGSGGCVDSDNALNVTLRKNGEYVLFLENAGLNHVMMFRWTPPGEGVAGNTKPTRDFEPLFSADALKSWRQCGPGRFVVTNGVATGEGGMGLWWYAGQQFTNFILRGEFVQEQDIADSGVFLRFPEPGQDPWVAVNRGHEMEIGDPDPKDPTWRTGSIYPFAASTKANTKPLGQWNTFEITCAGQDYTVRINEEVVTRWTDPKARTSHGFIGLQNYNDHKTVRHRNLRIRQLP